MISNNNRNYQRELDKLLNELEDEYLKIKEDTGLEAPKKKLMIHCCCAPCSSYCLLYLSKYFDITCFYYNPNISPEAECVKRVNELERFINTVNLEYDLDIKLIVGKYDPERFYALTKGMEDIPEGNERCFVCYRMRMEETAKEAVKLGADYFTTTLSISPLKRAEKINEIGEELGEIFSVKHLPSDFKKKNGYKQSVELSQKYELYRQNYCGCVFSKR